MSNTNDSSVAPEYVTSEVVDRADGEAYVFDAWVLSGSTTTETRAYTYGRTEGLYKVSVADNAEVVELFDEALAQMQDKYGAVDEAQFERIDDDAYEVMVEIVPAADVAAYDSQFDNNRALAYVSPSTDEGVVELVDEAFGVLGAAVSDGE